MNQMTVSNLTDTQNQWVKDQSKARGLSSSAVVKILIQDQINLEAIPDNKKKLPKHRSMI